MIKRASGIYLFGAVVLTLAILDIALLERKYDLFTGGFLLRERVATFGARALFGAAVLMLELSLAGCFWYLFQMIGRVLKAPPQQTRLLFLFLYGGGNLVGMVVKYKILSYFGDFLSIAVLRNLGGGSLTDALRYGMSEFAWAAAWLVPAIIVGVLVFRRLMKRVSAEQAPARPAGSMGGLALGLVGCLALLLGTAAAANANATMRRYLPKTAPFALARGVIDEIVSPKRPLLEQLAKGIPPAGPAPAVTVSFGPRKDNLVLIVSESTRADVIDAEVDGKPVTPEWRQLAQEGGSAPRYYSHTGFTTSSLKALFLGSLDNSAPMGGSLFEVLKRNGYQVVVISGQNEAFGNIDRDSKEAVADIFFDARSAPSERVFTSTDPGSLALSNGRVVQQFEAVAQRIDWRRPVFFYVNLQAAHFPYYYQGMPRTLDHHPLDRSQISEETRAQLKQTYYNAVAYSDWATAQIVQRLKQQGVYERSLVAVSGDHGESLFDDGVLGHGIRLADSEMHALLVANRKLPAFAGLLGQRDLAPELLKGIGATVSGSERHIPVLQFIGAPSMPVELGYVYPDGRRFEVQNADREIRASWLPAPLDADTLVPGGREYREARNLVREWQDEVVR